MSYAVPYLIVSSLSGDPKVGLFPVSSLTKKQATVPVVAGGRVVNWTASQNIYQGGPVKLAVGPFPYTAEYEGNVAASNDPEYSQDWYIISVSGEDGLFYIADSPDLQTSSVWTAEYAGGPIRIEPFAARSEQTFQFIIHLV